MPGILLLVYVGALMFLMRHFAGPLVHKLSPVGLLWLSCLMGSLAACGNSRETCDLANVSDVYTAWPWEPARNGSDRKISGSSVARSWTRRRMPFTIG